MHIGNIITNGMEDWWIDLGDFSYGNPLFDLGMMYLAAKCNPDDMTQRLYHISNEQFGRLWDIFVRAYYGTDDDKAIADLEAQIAKCAALKMLYFGERDQLYPPMREFIKQQLLP